MKIDGTHNFRDTGGTPLASGGATASGVLYRSDALSALSPEGLEQLADTSIGVIVDFRTPSEQQMAPDRLPSSRPIRVVEIALLEGALPGPAAKVADAVGPDAAATALREALAQLPTLAELYVSMLTHGAEALADLARLVAAPALEHTGEPAASGVLVHCTAGKDRTGVSVAVLLDAVGADRDAVVADYASSADNLAGVWADAMLANVTRMGVALSPQIVELVTLTPAAAITAALDWVDQQHGSSSAYLQSGGLTDRELAALRGRMIG